MPPTLKVSNDRLARGPAIQSHLPLCTDSDFSFSHSQYATDYKMDPHNMSNGNITLEKVKLFVRSLVMNTYKECFSIVGAHTMHLFSSRAENFGVWVGCSKHMVLVCFFGYLPTWPKSSVCSFAIFSGSTSSNWN